MTTAPDETSRESQYSYSQTLITISRLIARDYYVGEGETRKINVPGTDVVLIVKGLTVQEFDMEDRPPCYGNKTTGINIEGDERARRVHELLSHGRSFFTVTMQGSPAEQRLLFSLPKTASAEDIAGDTRDKVDSIV